MLRGEDGTRFTQVDRVLMVAHTIAADLLCSGCGQPKHESFNPDSEGWYEVHDETCNGCAAIARDQEIHKEMEIERKVHVVDTRPADKPLRPWTPGS